MELHMSWAAAGIMIAVGGHAVFTVWSAATFKATVVTKIDGLVTAILRLDKELEKRDTQISATWKKIDGINDRLTKVEAKVEIK